MRAAPEEAEPAFRVIARNRSRRVDIAKPSSQIARVAEQGEYRVKTPMERPLL
jgi:hypothetical protein